MPKRQPTPTPGSKAVDLVALSMAVKGTALSEAKREIAEGATHPVRLLAEVVGELKRHQGKPAMEGTKAAAVNLCTYDALLALLVKLGIGPNRLRAALLALTEHITDAADVASLGSQQKTERLDRVIAEFSLDLAGKLPPVKVTRDATAGRLSFDVESLTFLDPSAHPCRSNRTAA